MNTAGNTASKASALSLIHSYSFTQVLLSLALLMHTTAIYHSVTQTFMYNPASCLNKPSLKRRLCLRCHCWSTVLCCSMPTVLIPAHSILPVLDVVAALTAHSCLLVDLAGVVKWWLRGDLSVWCDLCFFFHLNLLVFLVLCNIFIFFY